MDIKPRTLVVVALGIALFGGLAYVSFRPDPVPVDLTEVTIGPMEVTIDADGMTRIRDIYEVAAPISGTALRAPVRAGDAVTGGETVVAVVTPVTSGLLDARSRAQAEAALQEAEAALQVAESALRQATEERIFAQTQYDRTQTLVERGVATITQLEDATQRLAIATAAAEAAQARIDMSEATLARARATLQTPENGGEGQEIALTAPVDGVVLEVPVISERPVSAGTVLVSIGDPGDLEIVADLLSADAVRLSPGARAHVDRWGGDGTLQAELVRIEPSARTQISALGIEEQRVDAVFAITSPPERRQGLGDGFSVFLRVVEWAAEEVVQVPLSAVFRRGEDWAVFVLTNGVAEERAVTLGHRNTRQVEVLDGLAPGERVITHPSDAVEDGVGVVDRATL